MDANKYSQTAIRSALLRAAHLVFDDDPKILNDNVIGRLLEEASDKSLRSRELELRSDFFLRMRSIMTLRVRFAEDMLAEAVQRGVKQYVLLGAGFDTFAYRQPQWATDNLEIFEVDHPASQEYKRFRLMTAGVPIPKNVHFVPIDFDRMSIEEGLERSSLRRDSPIMASFLGVAMYLERPSVVSTLRTVGQWPGGAEFVGEFVLDDWSKIDEGCRQAMERAQKRSADAGEPWLSKFSIPDTFAMLKEAGFVHVEHFDPEKAKARYCQGRTDQLLPQAGVSLFYSRTSS